MSTISVVISAFNEEAKIRDCLESVEWADEIIFIDNSSTDDTPNIVKKYTSKIYKRENNPLMLNVNKNYGIGKATGEWIFYLDADERVTPELRKEIEAKIRNSKFEIRNSHVDGYWIPRKNIIFGKWIEYAGWYPDYQMRLIRRGKGKFPERHVHEMIEVDGKTAHLKEPILHLNYETVSQFLHKHIELYAPNEAEALLRRGYKLSPIDVIRFPSSEFLSRFFAREGYKDGLHGLVLSLLMAFYHLIIFLKLWEKEKFKGYNPPSFFEIISTELKKAFSEISYWIANEKLKQSKNLIEKYMLRLERKLKS